jgi:RHS repeat-associated protein
MAFVNPFRFSTKYQDDETSLLYYGYRFYNSSTGRWLSRDPIVEQGFAVLQATQSQSIDDSDEPDLYCFVGNDAIRGFDFLGLKSRCDNDTDCLRCLLFHEGRGQNSKCLAALRDAIVNKSKLNKRTICQEAVGGAFSGAADKKGNPSGNYQKCCDQNWCADVTKDKKGHPIKPYNPDKQDMAPIDTFIAGNNVLVSENGEITRFLSAGTKKPSSWKNFVQVDVPGCSAFTFWKEVADQPTTKSPAKK